MPSHILIPQAEVKPYGIFHGLAFDISGLREFEDFGPRLLPNEERLVRDITVKNLVTQVGLNGWAKIENGESGFSGVVNYCALGTGANAPNINDTELQNEVGRAIMTPASNVRTNNVNEKSFYFGPDVANGEIKEIGCFVDGTASADSGTMFDRALFDITKSSTIAVFIYFSITFSA